jgi:hypothetical protein
MQITWWKFVMFVILAVLSYIALYPWYSCSTDAPCGNLVVVIISLIVSWPLICIQIVESYVSANNVVQVISITLFLMLQIVYIYLLGCFVVSVRKKIRIKNGKSSAVKV